MSDTDLAVERAAACERLLNLPANYPWQHHNLTSQTWNDCRTLADAYLCLAERDRRIRERCKAVVDYLVYNDERTVALARAILAELDHLPKGSVT